MDAFFNALKARFQKGGTVKKYPTGAKIDTTGEKRKEAQEKGRGMDPKGASKWAKKTQAGPAQGTKKKEPATDKEKAAMREASKKNFPKGIGKKRYGGSR
jgi:hypothetical protein